MAALPSTGWSLPNDLLAEALLLAGPVVALDVFDTLVERSVRPEHVKILACDRLVQQLGLDGVCALDLYARRQRIERALGHRNLAKAGESEFRHSEMAEELHAELYAHDLLPSGLGVARFAAAALRAELAVERQVLRVKPGALDALQAARSASKQVLLVSDFYMPAPALAELLASVGIARALYDSLYVSCERMASKRSGRLFDIVLTETGHSASDVTMFGDNPHSDVAMAAERGLRAVLVQDEMRIAFYTSEAADVTQPRRLLDNLRELVEAPDAPSTHLRHAVPGLLLFTERLYRAARRQNLRHLFFLAREGQILEHMFNAYQDTLGEETSERISTHYLLVSRRACYAASLAPLAEEHFEGLFAHYRSISLRDFCSSLGFSDMEVARMCVCLARDPDVVEPDFPNSDTFRALRAAPDFVELYETHRNAQRDNLRSYLAAFNVDLSLHPLAVVDCGWKGSIQDFLRGALPSGLAVQGFYIGLIDVGQDVSAKEGLLFSNVRGLSPDYLVFAENRSLFEVLLCANHGSAAGYERGPDGRIRAVLDDDPIERHFIQGTVLPIAQDAMQVFRALADIRATTVVGRRAWERMVVETHARLVFRPWLPYARWLMEAQHRESFGVFHLSRLTYGGTASIKGRLRFLAELLRHPRTVISESFWPASMLYAHGGRLLVYLYVVTRHLRGRMRQRQVPKS